MLMPIPHLWLILLAAILVGVGGTLWGGSAAAGRRVARPATVTAALGVDRHRPGAPTPALA